LRHRNRKRQAFALCSVMAKILAERDVEFIRRHVLIPISDPARSRRIIAAILAPGTGALVKARK